MGSEPPNEVKPRNSLWYDVLVGGGLGLALAVFGLLGLALVASSDARPGASVKGCLLVLALLFVVAVGAAAGFVLAGATGAAVGGVAGYVIPFVGFGIYTQRTTGWATWRFRRPKSKQRD